MEALQTKNLDRRETVDCFISVTGAETYYGDFRKAEGNDSRFFCMV